MDRHRFFDDASLAGLTLGTHMLLCDIKAFHYHFIDLWHGPRNCPLLPPILAGDDQDGVTFLNVHLGKMERLFLFLSYCHLLPPRRG
jgi:hypothetical protein